MWLLISGLLVCALPGLWVLSKAPGELNQRGRLSTTTFIATFIGLVGLAAAIMFASFVGAWPLAMSQAVALAIGLPLSALGATIYALARLRFRSFRLTWGLASGRLVTDGIYRFSRNPQIIGSLLFWSGVGVVGRSAVALLLVLVLLVACLTWLPIEELFLKQKFGEAYERYCNSVPRFKGKTRHRPRTDFRYPNDFSRHRY